MTCLLALFLLLPTQLIQARCEMVPAERDTWFKALAGVAGYIKGRRDILPGAALKQHSSQVWGAGL